MEITSDVTRIRLATFELEGKSQIWRDYELEISRILLTVDLRVMDILEFDVILRMDWLMAHRVVIDCDSMRIIASTRDGTFVTFQGEKHDVLPYIVHDSRWSGPLMGWLASFTLKDEGSVLDFFNHTK